MYGRLDGLTREERLALAEGERLRRVERERSPYSWRVHGVHGVWWRRTRLLAVRRIQRWWRRCLSRWGEAPGVRE